MSAVLGGLGIDGRHLIIGGACNAPHVPSLLSFQIVSQ